MIDWEELDVKKGDLKVKENILIVKCADTEKFVKLITEIKD